MSQRLEAISYKGYRYTIMPSYYHGVPVPDIVQHHLIARRKGPMAGYVWAKVRVNNDDGSFFYVKRKGVT